jgi:hypothetical protein
MTYQVTYTYDTYRMLYRTLTDSSHLRPTVRRSQVYVPFLEPDEWQKQVDAYFDNIEAQQQAEAAADVDELEALMYASYDIWLALSIGYLRLTKVGMQLVVQWE